MKIKDIIIKEFFNLFEILKRANYLNAIFKTVIYINGVVALSEGTRFHKHIELACVYTTIPICNMLQPCPTSHENFRISTASCTKARLIISTVVNMLEKH